eukprot:CAMPEP_0198148092 /NCGR_PEP_ID=MMETSP1443-20131203/39716_1 /TAXON_ID=186043 /ORGANISM="Entomoneis sp., Strain CCMP2396" /LENGTH=366 /DNA_ID=CAMNT_0043812677 /DNA_START=61 /DNA_END=1161 /DNA_ORIENTATION=+
MFSQPVRDFVGFSGDEDDFEFDYITKRRQNDNHQNYTLGSGLFDSLNTLTAKCSSNTRQQRADDTTIYFAPEETTVWSTTDETPSSPLTTTASSSPKTATLQTTKTGGSSSRKRLNVRDTEAYHTKRIVDSENVDQDLEKNKKTDKADLPQTRRQKMFSKLVPNNRFKPSNLFKRRNNNSNTMRSNQQVSQSAPRLSKIPLQKHKQQQPAREEEEPPGRKMFKNYGSWKKEKYNSTISSASTTAISPSSSDSSANPPAKVSIQLHNADSFSLLSCAQETLEENDNSIVDDHYHLTKDKPYRIEDYEEVLVESFLVESFQRAVSCTCDKLEEDYAYHMDDQSTQFTYDESEGAEIVLCGPTSTSKYH